MSIHGAAQHSTAPGPVQYHGGPVMQHTTTYAIFWEPPTLQNGTPSHVSKRYNNLLMGYFNDVGGTELYDNNAQYYDGSGHIMNSSAFGTAWVDTSPYPAATCSYTAASSNCLTDAQIQTEIARAMDINGWTADLTRIFFVFTARGEGSCVDSSSKSCAFTNYCAYHSNFTVNGQTVVYANIPYAGTDLSACGVPDSPNSNIDADSAINVASHEQMGAVTDPQQNAWYNVSGDEIADPCNWNFNNLHLKGGTANVDWRNHFYIVQREWSNVFGQCVVRGQQGSVFVTGYNGDLCDLNTNDGYARWCYSTPRIQGSSPSLANGVIYFGSDDVFVHAVNNNNGRLLWRYRTDNQLVTSSPVVQDGVVYVASTSLYALNAKDGSLLWRHRFQYGASSSPTVVNGTIYIGEGDDYTYALNATDGSVLWRYQTKMYIYSTAPAVVNGVVYVGSSNYSIYALNASDGSLLWSYATGGAINSSAAVSNGIVYIGAGDNYMYALHVNDGSLAWRYSTGGPVWSTPSVVNGILYFGSNNNFVYALHAGDGSLLWSYQTGGRVFSSPNVVNSLLYVGSEDSYVYALNTSDGTLSWRSQMGGSVYTTPEVHLRILEN
jgi:outer membrane protein assembly factor BamB